MIPPNLFYQNQILCLDQQYPTRLVSDLSMKDQLHILSESNTLAVRLGCS
jgi:hypothetical protein